MSHPSVEDVRAAFARAKREFLSDPHIPHYEEHLARAVLALFADERARIVREMREYISRDEPTTFAQGWNRAIEVVSARIESEVSNR